MYEYAPRRHRGPSPPAPGRPGPIRAELSARVDFLSDNASPVHPAVLAKMAEVNVGDALPYGDDPVTHALVRRLEEVFETPDLAVFLVNTGTVANCFLLSALTTPYGAVFCNVDSHLVHDESTAPALFTSGARLVTVEGEGALIDPAALAARLETWPQGDVHSPQAEAVALTQASELGQVYTLDHLDAVADVARANGLPIFLDGARFANAVVTTGASPADLTWRRGVRAFTFGTTKNGTMNAEAAIVFGREPDVRLPFLQKRAGQLTSKMRYVSAQVLALLEDDLWLQNAAHANEMARRLAGALAPFGRVLNPLESNELFVELPAEASRRLEAAGYALYPVPAYGTLATRFVTSWDTRQAQIETLVDVLRGTDGAGPNVTDAEA